MRKSVERKHENQTNTDEETYRIRSSSGNPKEASKQNHDEYAQYEKCTDDSILLGHNRGG